MYLNLANLDAIFHQIWELSLANLVKVVAIKNDASSVMEFFHQKLIIALAVLIGKLNWKKVNEIKDFARLPCWQLGTIWQSAVILKYGSQEISAVGIFFLPWSRRDNFGGGEFTKTHTPNIMHQFLASCYAFLNVEQVQWIMPSWVNWSFLISWSHETRFSSFAKGEKTKVFFLLKWFKQTGISILIIWHFRL
jgi:hypothetical protein